MHVCLSRSIHVSQLTRQGVGSDVCKCRDVPLFSCIEPRRCDPGVNAWTRIVFIGARGLIIEGFCCRQHVRLCIALDAGRSFTATASTGNCNAAGTGMHPTWCPSAYPPGCTGRAQPPASTGRPSQCSSVHQSDGLSRLYMKQLRP